MGSGEIHAGLEAVKAELQAGHVAMSAAATRRADAEATLQEASEKLHEARSLTERALSGPLAEIMHLSREAEERFGAAELQLNMVTEGSEHPFVQRARALTGQAANISSEGLNGGRSIPEDVGVARHAAKSALDFITGTDRTLLATATTLMRLGDNMLTVAGQPGDSGVRRFLGDLLDKPPRPAITGVAAQAIEAINEYQRDL